MSYTRKLVAIMFTDIVGYTKLMQESEGQALALRTRHRSVLEEVHEGKNGRIIQYQGDGSLSIFESVIDCVHAAIAIQQTLSKSPRVPLRIGIHAGDVMITDTDIVGDSVNLASRVESLAISGSILVSDKVEEDIKNQNISLQLMGNFHLKNDEYPRDIYAVVGDGLVVPNPRELNGKLESGSRGMPNTVKLDSEEHRSMDDVFAEKVRSIVRTNLSDPQFSVEKLGKEVGYSRPQLYRKLQATMGTSPNELIREMRLQRAASLLQNNTATVSEIAFLTGFNNLSYFSKSFQERFGHSPSSHAKQAKKSYSLPVELTRFIGRQHELAEIKGLLKEVRLLTLSGTGGTGKTRLASEVIRAEGKEYADGAYFVQLAPVTVASQVLPKVAQIIKLQQDPTRDTLELLKEFLADQEVLIVLDNFEHVIEAAADIGAILRAAPNLKILVTSRIVLNISGEYEYEVPLLQIPQADLDYALDELAEIHSVKLFIDRVRRVKPGFELNNDNQASIIRICQQLDGLPLALELAAARMKLFSPEALLKRLANNQDILKSNAPDQPERHRTLRNAIDWSYGLLSPEEQTLFRRLSVFNGGCTLEAAEAVCFDDYRHNLDIVDVLLGLVDKSLIQREDQEDGEPRFLMLETLRSYGMDRLEKSLEKDTVMSKYAEYYIELVAPAESGLTGSEMKFWLRTIEIELDNLRALLGWFEKQGDAKRGLQLCVSFWRFWTIRTMMREGADWLGRILDIPTENPESTIRCRALNAYGVLFGLTKRIHNALAIFEESLNIARSINYREGIAQSLKFVAWIYYFKCRFKLFDEYSLEALEILIDLGRDRDVAAIYNNMGNKLRLEGKLGKAIHKHEDAANIMERIGDQRGYAYNICGIAWLQSLLGKYELCDKSLEKALSILSEFDDKQLIAFGHSIKAFNLSYNEKFEDARRLISFSRPLWRKSGNEYGDMMCDVIIAMVDFQTGNDVELHQVFAQDLDRSGETIDRTSALWLKQIKVRYYLKQGKFPDATALVLRNLKEQFTYGIELILADDLELLSVLLCQKDQAPVAVEIFSFAQNIRVKNGIVVPPIWKDNHSRLLTMIQQGLSLNEFESGLERGALMTNSDMVHLIEQLQN